MSINDLVENFFKEKFPEETEKVLDIFEFDTLIDVYQDAQKFGTHADRASARSNLKDAYRAALRAAGKDDR